ncbi:23231_t:CDS:2 [Gigaspora margarita]|uniref:23231_t:CDS:1 n=1 Tax=Gigaspora margarita TaxID=4874 RepID=A0ABN7VAI0_GIGMA|nr:23231_t:CDS:2 [Gigaspora margarita]
MDSLFNGVLVKIIKEKPELKRSKLSIEEKTNIAISFYEKLEFRHRNREFAEQVFKKTNNNLLKDHDKKIKAYSNQISENNFQFLSHKTCEQYWNTLADERQHRLNAEKRVMEVDTIIGQKWVNDLGKRVMESDTTIGQQWVDDLSRGFKRRRREASPLARYSGISNAESLVDDMESDDTESDDETICEGDGDEFIESICTTQIINISDHETANQHDELKKWVLENRVIDITDKEKDEIENYVINVFERNIEETIKSIQDKKINLDQKDAEFIKRILDACDLKKAFRNAVDSLCTRFWSNREGDVEIARKYMELLTFKNELGNQGELWRVCIAGKDKCLAERIYKLVLLWRFEEWTKLADLCKMLLLIEKIFRHNDEIYYKYTKSAQNRNIVRLADWLSLNSFSP